MRDDEAFLRAIIDNPDDDLPRMVYADWLDEHGQPERAEFIRVQCELSRPPQARSDFDKLWGRSEELLAGHKEEWLGPLNDLVEFAAFHRGFVTRVTLSVATFLRRAEVIWRLAPVQRVGLKNAWEEMDKLAASPHLGRVRELGLPINQLGPTEIATLLESPYLTNLKALDVGYNRFHAPTVVELARCASLTNLRELDLSGNPVASRGVAAIAESPHLQSLSALKLWECNIGASGVEALAHRGVLPELALLELSGNSIGTRGVRALVHSSGLQNLKVLHLSDDMLSHEQKADLERRFGPGVCAFG
jgi:uncharacterized protein (TIGR02996 family)